MSHFAGQLLEFAAEASWRLQVGNERGVASTNVLPNKNSAQSYQPSPCLQGVDESPLLEVFEH
jgi:hypothetical protein